MSPAFTFSCQSQAQPGGRSTHSPGCQRICDPFEIPLSFEPDKLATPAAPIFGKCDANAQAAQRRSKGTPMDLEGSLGGREENICRCWAMCLPWRSVGVRLLNSSSFSGEVFAGYR